MAADSEEKVFLADAGASGTVEPLLSCLSWQSPHRRPAGAESRFMVKALH